MTAELLPSEERGVCDICETFPVTVEEPDYGICAVCRVEITAACEVIHDPIERVLSLHWSAVVSRNPDWTLCRCCKRFEGGPAVHRRHVAEMVCEALGLPPPAPWTPASDEDDSEGTQP